MDMRIKDEILSPGVQNGEESDVGAEVFGVAGNRLERAGAGPEQQFVDNRLVCKARACNLRRDK